MVSRNQLILWALQAVAHRIPYVWGGKNPLISREPWPTGGLDCSGFVTYALHLLGGPDWRGSHNTDRLWTTLERIDEVELQPGDLVLYRGKYSTGPNDVEHVMVFVGCGCVVGQAFGGKANTSPGYSIALGHWTKALGLRYRNDVAGFARLPLT